MPTIIVKRTEEEFQEWLKEQTARAADMLVKYGLDPTNMLGTEVGWLLSLVKYRAKILELDFYQLRFLTVDTRFRSINKARQVGISFIFAGEGLSRCHLNDQHTAVMISYNQDDAQSKILIAKEMHEDLPLEFQKKIVVDSKSEVGFVSNNSKRKISRIISRPAKPPRGKTGDVYLDELAHCQADMDIYAGATAVISRSGGQLTMASTPLGKRGIFHDVHTETSKKYPGFWRQNIPWWLSRNFCKDVEQAGLLAPKMSTEERVAMFGTESLLGQFNALPIDLFQQEFELEFQDERVSFFPHELLENVFSVEKHKIPVYDNVDMLASEAHKLGPICAGFDVGRSKHPSELYAFDRQGAKYSKRFHESFRNVEFPDQRAYCINFIETLGEHLDKFRIDSTGLGANMAEDLKRRFPRKVEAVVFTNQTKEDIANNMKVLMIEGNLCHDKDRDTMAQFHSIKQKITTAGNAIFDVDKNNKHHADRVWAIGLAVFDKRRRIIQEAMVQMRTLGGTPPLVQSKPRDPAPPTGPTIVEQLFSPGKPKGPPKPAAPPKPIFERTAEVSELQEHLGRLAIGLRVYKRQGDEDEVRQVFAEYQRVRREIQRRGGAAPPAEVVAQV